MEDYPPLPDEPVVNENVRLLGEGLLEYTQRIRLSTIAAFTKNASLECPKEIAAITTLLDGIDRQEINKAKIEIDNQAAASDQEAFSLISALVNAAGNANPYEAAVPIERVLEHEGPVVAGVTLVPGELDSKPQQMNYDGFMKEYKRKNPKVKDDD